MRQNKMGITPSINNVQLEESYRKNVLSHATSGLRGDIDIEGKRKLQHSRERSAEPSSLLYTGQNLLADG